MSHTRNKILLIDDDARNIFALTAVLKAAGYASLSAGSAREGLDLLQKESDIAIVLLDMMMPEMDGYETIAVIRRTPALAAMPIVAVTAQAMHGDREKMLAAGADNYVSKPIDVDELIKMLQQYIN